VRDTGYLRPGLVLLISTLLMNACTNLGPRAVQQGRGDYNSVLRNTADEQLLANLVRLRYRDRPYFLEVSAVTTQFSFSPNLAATAAFGSPNIEQDALVSGGVTYTEQPTITYTPLQGDDFARHILTPVALEALVLLSHSGWSAERLLRVCVQRINGVPNAVTASGPTPDAAPDYQRFNQVAKWMRELQLRDQVTIGFDAEGDNNKLMLVFSQQALGSEEYLGITRTLGLSQTLDRFQITAGLRGGSNDRIRLQTRSLNGILYYLAHAVDVPLSHQAQGLVNITRDQHGNAFDWRELAAGLMRIQVASVRPESPHVRVFYRGHWYYIADNDLDSKSTFSLLAQLFALQAGSTEGVRPVLTLPVGG
jgi:hypothetical protein